MVVIKILVFLFCQLAQFFLVSVKTQACFSHTLCLAPSSASTV
jgi:hypothetical protein